VRNFRFRSPTQIIFGKGAESKIGKTLADGGYKRVLLLYGQQSAIRSGLLDRLGDSLTEAGLWHTTYGGVEANPKVQFVREAIPFVKEENIDFICAVGGGSVIDAAKAIAVGVKSDIDVWEMIEKQITPTQRVAIGSVLTLASAGSETSISMVLTNTDNNLKRSLNVNMLQPEYAFMNPELTFSVGAYQTGCGIVDTMMHTLERYCSSEGITPLTDRLAEGILLSVIEAGEVVMKDPHDYEGRSTLMWASSLSHNGLTGLGRGGIYFAAHKIEHDLSGVYDHIAHGAGLSVLFPAWALFMVEHDPSRFAQLAHRVWNVEYNEESDEKHIAKEGIVKMRRFFKSLGMPTTMDDLKVPQHMYTPLANMTTANNMKPLDSLIALTTEMIVEIYHLANIPVE
jgi:alcohol dehydrogenase YqhD (iron-dependent ADH family)